ncbi:hypothetical protein [Neobacillus sp. D3-1R]|uniref:hypothetical protein n=1 Tax=Neobacillus sp. D3-1R TaxID=3445778 RepID=UPI003F9F5D36
MRKVLIAVLFVFVLCFGFIFIRFGTALTQEGNPIPILTSIMKLELSNSGYEKISDEKYVSEFKENYPYEILKEYMSDIGWNFHEQLGSALVFVKNEKVIVMETRQFTRHYYLWKIPEEILGQND